MRIKSGVRGKVELERKRKTYLYERVENIAEGRAEQRTVRNIR